MAYNSSLSIDYTSTGDTFKVATQKIETEFNAAYNAINAVDDAYKAADSAAAAVAVAYQNKVLMVSQRVASGTDGGNLNPGGFLQRTFNTIDYNGIPGASRVDGQIFALPAGRFIVEAKIPAYGVGLHKAGLYVQADGYGGQSLILPGTVGSSSCAFSFISGTFVFAVPRSVLVFHWCASRYDAEPTREAGYPISLAGYDEIYNTMKIQLVSA